MNPKIKKLRAERAKNDNKIRTLTATLSSGKLKKGYIKTM